MATDEPLNEYASDERYATLRGRYISKTTDLRVKEGVAVAWSELGYSRGTIGRKMDTGKSTIQGYHEKAMALYGLEILEAHAPEAEETEYERINAEYVMGLSKQRQQAWLEAFNRQKSGLPQEWVAEVAPE